MSRFGISRLMGVPSVCPSNTPDRILTVSVSFRWLTSALCPGTRRSRSGWMSASDSGRRGGQPSTTAPMPAPWDSPHVVTRKSCPQLLPTHRGYSEEILRWDVGPHEASPAHAPPGPRADRTTIAGRVDCARHDVSESDGDAMVDEEGRGGSSPMLGGRRAATLFVERSTRQWVVRDPEGRFWVLPSVDDPWPSRLPFLPTDE